MTTATTRRTFRRTMLTTAAGAVLAASGLAGAGAANAATPAASGSGSVLSAIRECESGGDYRAENPNSTASGAYQFLDSTWQTLDAAQGYSRAKNAPKSVQDAAAQELYAQAGTSPWLASKSCWG